MELIHALPIALLGRVIVHLEQEAHFAIISRCSQGRTEQRKLLVGIDALGELDRHISVHLARDAIERGDGVSGRQGC